MRTRNIDTQSEQLLILETAEELPRAITDLCLQQSISSAIVSGSGRAMWLTLEGGPAGRRRVAGPLEVLQVQGTVEQQGKRMESELRVVACREMDTGLEMVGGVLVEGKFERALVRLARHLPASRASADLAQGAWGAVAAASASLGEPNADTETESPAVGDRVHHPKFGMCVVKGLDESHLRVRLEGGRTVSLGLSHLSWSLKGELSTGQRVFDLHIGKA